MAVWLIDYTTYSVKIDSLLSRYKRDYFSVKSYVRKKIIGNTATIGHRTYSMGLLRIATILNYNGVKVKYLHHEDFEKILNEGCDLPETVAFSTVCPTIPRCHSLVPKIKELSPYTEVIVGGVHVMNAPIMTKQKYPLFDIYNTEADDISAAGRIAGIDMKIPKDIYVDFSLLPYDLSEYHINTMTAVGCPYTCEYCIDNKAHKKFVSDDCMVGMIRDKLKPRTLVHVFDSVFGYDTQRVKRICENLINEGNPFILSCDMRAEMIDAKIIKTMEKAGIKEIRLGIESADTEMLRQNKRFLTPFAVEEKLKVIKDNSNIYTTLYSATGLPGTTEDIQKKTCDMFGRLLNNHIANEVKNCLYVPYPYDYTDYKSQDIRIVDDDWSHYDRQSYPVFETGTMTREMLWNAYLETQRLIAEYWLESTGYGKFTDLPDNGGYYNEYVINKYNI